MLNNEKSATGGKIKKEIIFALAIVFVFSFFVVREAQAQSGVGCCVVSAGNCLDTSGNTCSNGTYNPSACSSIATCSSSITPPGNGIEIPTDTGLADASIKDILRNLLVWLLGIVGIIALIAFAISGIQYLIAAGSEEMMETAKRNMLYSIIGVVVVLASFVIIQAIDFALRAQTMF